MNSRPTHRAADTFPMRAPNLMWRQLRYTNSGRANRIGQVKLSIDPNPIKGAMTSATVISVYMDNINADVLEHQRRCVERCLPIGWTFRQYRSRDSHPVALSQCMNEGKDDILILLDIDCIPLRERALLLLYRWAKNGVLVGAVQRANHIKNNGHLYVGPFCMAFSKSRYKQMGSPTFLATCRGDVGEELTYRWHENGGVVFFLWPSHVEHPMWPLVGERHFGLGTTYEDLFYHAFCIRQGATRDLFLAKCSRMLDEQETA